MPAWWTMADDYRPGACPATIFLDTLSISACPSTPTTDITCGDRICRDRQLRRPPALLATACLWRMAAPFPSTKPRPSAPHVSTFNAQWLTRKCPVAHRHSHAQVHHEGHCFLSAVCSAHPHDLPNPLHFATSGRGQSWTDRGRQPGGVGLITLAQVPQRTGLVLLSTPSSRSTDNVSCARELAQEQFPGPPRRR